MLYPTDPRNAYYSTGWVAPNGDFYPCPYYNHADTGVEIIDTLGLDGNRWYAHDILYGLNWLHIGGEDEDAGQCDMGYGKSATQAQINTAFDIAMCAGREDDHYANLMMFVKAFRSAAIVASVGPQNYMIRYDDPDYYAPRVWSD